MAIPLDNALNEEINGLIDEYNDILYEYSQLKSFYFENKNNLNDFRIHSNKKLNIDSGLIDIDNVQDVNECKAFAENLSGNGALFNIHNNECAVINTFPVNIDNNDNFDSIVINQDYILSMLDNLVTKLDSKNDLINGKLDSIDDSDLKASRLTETQNLETLIADYENFRNSERNFVNRQDLDDLTNIEKLSELNTKSYSYWFYLSIIVLLFFILIIINISYSKSPSTTYSSAPSSSNVSNNTVYYVCFSIIMVILFVYMYNIYRL